MNCLLCPIREECDKLRSELKQLFLNRVKSLSKNDDRLLETFKKYLDYRLEVCPLVQIITDYFREEGNKIVTLLKILEREYESKSRG